MVKAIHIFRAGEHTAMSGATAAFSEDQISEMAEVYDPALHEAPIVIGHPKTDGPAYGWVDSLFADTGDLIASPKQVEPQFAEMVRDGRFKKISASFYTPLSPNNPVPGKHYLKHVGFLGAQPPAVKGLKQAEFAEDDDALVIELEFSDALSVSGGVLGAMRRIARGLRDHLLATDGQDAADRVVPDYEIEGLRVAEEQLREAAEGFSESENQITENQEEADMSGSNEPGAKTPTAEELAARETDLKTRLAAFAEEQATARREKDQAFLDQLAEDGRIAPGLKGEMLAFMENLDGDDEISFAEGATPISRRAWFRNLLESKTQKLISFGEVSGDEKRPEAVSNTSADITAAANKLIKEAEAEGRNLNFSEAARQVEATLED